MTELIRELLDRRPFVPFRITMGGKVPSHYDVTDPGSAELTPSVVRLYRPDPAAPDGRQWAAVLALEHVAAVDTTAADHPYVVPAGG